MVQITASPKTEHASRYLQQLCKHWGHKFEARFDQNTGEVKMPFGRLNLYATDDKLLITIKKSADADPETLKSVIEQHLNRFAFKEGDLDFEWAEEMSPIG